jgi:hypothetical protein
MTYEPIVDPEARSELAGEPCGECKAPIGYWCKEDCPIGGKIKE